MKQCKLAYLQNLSQACATVKSQGRELQLGELEGDVAEEDDQASTLTEVPRKRNKSSRTWIKTDLSPQEAAGFDCKDPETSQVALHISPARMFEKFSDESVCQHIINETLSYAKQKGEHSFKFNTADLKVFFGVALISGYSPVARRRMYWAVKEDTRNHAIANAVTRATFERWLRFIHLADNTNLPVGDKYGKVRPLVDMLNMKFVQYFPIQQNLSIDESMIKYFGRHSLKQCIRNKPIRFGFKVWCCATVDGYCVTFQPYQGAADKQRDAHLGLGGTVVMRLLENLPTYPYHIFVDNFFSTLELFEAAPAKGCGITGTIRANRVQQCPFPTTDEFKKLERGAMTHFKDKTSGIVLVRWHDNSIVTVGSTVYGVTPTVDATRWSRKESKPVKIPQPYLIQKYTKCMGGVDQLDHNVSDYRINVNCKKWWWNVFTFLIDMSVHNAYRLYSRSEAAKIRPLDQMAFRQEVADVYRSNYRDERSELSLARSLAPSRRLGVPEDIRSTGNHFAATRKTQRHCRVCGSNTMRYCTRCSSNGNVVALHDRRDCFRKFHSRP